MARLRKKMQAAGITGSAETSRHSPRDGFTAYIALSPVRRLFGHRHLRDAISVLTNLAISIGMPGPHDLTVRIAAVRRRNKHAATSTRPPHPASTFVTIAKRPSGSRQDIGKKAHFLKKRNKILLLKDWTTSIGLKDKQNYFFQRTRFLRRSGPAFAL